MKDKKYDAKYFLNVCSGVLFLASAFFLIIFLMAGKETRTHNGDVVSSTEVLYCTKANAVGSFFNSNALAVSDEIKMTFNDNKIDKVTYTLTGEYGSVLSAKNDLAIAHADYNIYMGKTSIYQEDLTPTFSTIEVKNIINIFMDKDTFTRDTAVFAYINSNDFDQALKYSASEFEMYYERKGFTCEYKK